MNVSDSNGVLASSFRDPGGFLFRDTGVLYRQINKSCQDNYHLLMNSGLYSELVSRELMISHSDADLDLIRNESGIGVIKPEEIDFISYPYEWCYSQLKTAALATLRIQNIALEHGASLKDASAYNIQFHKGKPVLIDTLSFEKQTPGEPWVAYKQFCQHFLAPLALASYCDIRLFSLLKNFIDGIPLDMVSSLLPTKTKLVFSLQAHIHLHAKSQLKYANKIPDRKKMKANLSKHSVLALISSLESAIQRLEWKPGQTEWGDYYNNTNYSYSAKGQKSELIGKFLKIAEPKRVWDLGANTGFYSNIASSKEINTIAFDLDPIAVEKNFIQIQKEKDSFMLPLLLDLTNPSPSIGWNNRERLSFLERGPVDMIFALALIHHIAISNNVPLKMVADFFHQSCKWLIIEFVPKTDSQVKRLLATREDVFVEYSQECFERDFKNRFDIVSSEKISDSHRVLYLMRAK